MTPRVSVVVPTRDRAAELAGALASVRAQTFAGWECIVADDGSRAGTADVVAGLTRIDPRIRSVRREPGGSIAGARNAGLAAANCELVAFLDDDDRWLPDKLAGQIPLLDAEPGVAMVCGRVELTGDAVGVWPRRPAPVYPTLRTLLASNVVPVCTVVARRSAVEEAGGFDESLPVAEDHDLWLRLAMRWLIRAEPRVVARYRVDAARAAAQRGAQIEALEAIVAKVAATGSIPSAWLHPARRRIARYRARHATYWLERLAAWRRALL